jgi:hypothetical protein
MAKLRTYFRWLIVLLSACIVCLIVLFIALLSVNQPILDKHEEIEYLTVYLSDDNNEMSKIEEIDSILIVGGTIKTKLSKEALIDTGLLNSSMLNGSSKKIDYLNPFLNYIGAFGWNLIETNNEVLLFSRSVQL